MLEIAPEAVIAACLELLASSEREKRRPEQVSPGSGRSP